MSDALRIKLSHAMLRVPAFIWQRVVAKEARDAARGFAKLTADERRVREWVVAALPDRNAPLEPEWIATELGLSAEVTERALDTLEKKLMFLARNERDQVSWAYPVTVDAMPHHLAFESGERMTAA